jgi:hypothetical protein
MLKTWLFDHHSNPYPTEDEKKDMAERYNLTINQVNNWFINARRRLLQPLQKKATVSGKQPSADYTDMVANEAMKRCFASMANASVSKDGSSDSNSPVIMFAPVQAVPRGTNVSGPLVTVPSNMNPTLNGVPMQYVLVAPPMPASQAMMRLWFNSSSSSSPTTQASTQATTSVDARVLSTPTTRATNIVATATPAPQTSVPAPPTVELPHTEAGYGGMM